jgi:hypothetical protein
MKRDRMTASPPGAPATGSVDGPRRRLDVEPKQVGPIVQADGWQ